MKYNKKIIIARAWIAHVLKAAMLLCLVFLFGSCALSNVGSVDMRRTVAAPTHGASPSVDAEHLPLTCKNFSIGGSTQVRTGDSLSVTFRTAFIKDFFELSLNPARMFQSNGEIAVVANAFEVETGKEIDFVKMQSGRLVFFSDDVAKGQLLNFNNLPIYGPKSYTGQPFALRITIFELDGGTEQAKTLLNSIAKAGSAAYAPASPVLNLLNGIGQSLFDGEQNDTEFRYTMQLNPRPGSELVNSFVLQSGNYVFVRLEDRTQKVPWEELELNENRGELFWREKRDSRDQPLRYIENTYIVVEINTGGSARDIDLKQNTYEELLAALEIQDKAAAERMSSATTAVETRVDEVLIRRIQTTNFNAAKQALNIIRDNEAANSLKRESAEQIIRILSESLDSNGKLKPIDAKNRTGPILSNVHIDYVISNLRSIVEIRKKILSSKDYSRLSRERITDKGDRQMILDLIAPLDKGSS
jgi:hypothetical protein